MMQNSKTAIFAGGCFWCTESDFQDENGVLRVVPGYTGGNLENPTYAQVSSGTTGHKEAVLVEYDPKKISYETLLDIFWSGIDPHNAKGQFCDIGPQYKTAVFYTDDHQKEQAEESLRIHQKQLDAPIVTDILPADTFYTAEEYHHDYAVKNPIRYKAYRQGSGRDRRLSEVWSEQ